MKNSIKTNRPALHRYRFALGVALGGSLLLSGFASAAERLSFLPDSGDANLTFYLDNDLFADTDENYTNGARLSWVSGSRDPAEFGWVQNLLRKLSGDSQSRALIRKLSGFSDPESLEYNYGMSLTQLMFTPEDTDALSTPPGERPYAGWLGIDFSVHVKDTQALNSVTLAIGTTGPHAFAEETQDLVHDIRGQDKFSGWNSQVPNELTVNVYSTQQRRLTIIEPHARKFAIDGVTEWRAGLGNFYTGVNASALLRLGWNLPLDFADPRLSVTSYSHQPFKTKRRQRAVWSIYGMTGIQGAMVAHNITLDGPVFRNFDTGTESKTFVGEAFIGFGVRFRRWNFSYAYTYRSKEFRDQDDAQAFGSVSLGYSL